MPQLEAAKKCRRIFTKSGADSGASSASITFPRFAPSCGSALSSFDELFAPLNQSLSEKETGGEFAIVPGRAHGDAKRIASRRGFPGVLRRRDSRLCGAASRRPIRKLGLGPRCGLFEARSPSQRTIMRDWAAKLKVYGLQSPKAPPVRESNGAGLLTLSRVRNSVPTLGRMRHPNLLVVIGE